MKRVRSRMERYLEETDETYSRSSKNQDLYKDIEGNTKYTNFTDVVNANAIDLDAAKKNYRTREGYHQMKEYDDIIPTTKVQKELDEFNYLYQDHENRVYDINSVLQEARKNRIEKDALEEKRNLKNTNYNILASLKPGELEQKKKMRTIKNKKPDEEELKELLDTITSKTLKGELDQATSVSLLSDLMATNLMDKVEKPEEDEQEEKDKKLSLSKEILDKEQLDKMNSISEDTKPDIMKNMDQDFYTRSMDLSDKDFDMDDEFKEDKIPVVVKILLILVLLTIVGVVVFFIWQKL